MILESILLQNFRNHTKTKFSFQETTSLIVGPNAAGKTNILEAIYLLASGKSFRVKGVEGEMIRYNEEITRVTGKIIQLSNYPIENYEGKDGVTLEIVLTDGEVGGEKAGKKKYFVNGVARRMVDFLGNFRAVYFGPEDLELIIGSPSGRRKYLDMVLSQVDREYSRAILSYEKGLRSRNKILEEMRETGDNDRRKLFFWDQLLIKNGNLITEKRQEHINFVNSSEGFMPASPAKRGEGVGGFGIEYDQSIISRERLEQYEREEVAAATTLVGPHRDDFSVQIRNSKFEIRNLAIYGSRGEQRLAVLWLKLGERNFIKSKTESFPVLLLDDIFSELDVPHRKLVFDIVGEQQTIITTADLGMVEKKWLSGVKLIEL